MKTFLTLILALTFAGSAAADALRRNAVNGAIIGGVAGAVVRDVPIDARYGDRFIDIRKKMYPDGNYPASALITVAGFARPNMMVEIQCVAVVPE